MAHCAVTSLGRGEEVTIVIVSKQRLEQPHTSTTPHSHTDKGAYQSGDWAKVKCVYVLVLCNSVPCHE